MLAYFIHDLNPFVIQFANGWGIRWYGLSYVLAFVAGYWLYVQLAKRGYSDLPASQVGDLITGTALFGVVLGGRLGYMLFYDWQNFVSNPLVFFRIMDGGMSSHGGMLGVIAFTWYYAHRKKVPWTNLGDNLVVVAPLGLFFGRVANFINGELYGRVASVPWAVQFPKELYEAPPETVQLALQEAVTINPDWTSITEIVDNVRFSPELREQLAGTLSPRHPSQLYAAFLEGALLFVLLWILRTRFRLPNGVLTGVFFIAYAILRIMGEFFREPDAPLTGTLTRGQFLSLFLIIVGAAFVIFAWRRPTWAPKFR